MNSFGKAETQPDIVTMDLNMLKMGGLEELQELLRNIHSAKIVIISAFNQRTMIFDALEKGAKHLYNKTHYI